MMIQQIHETSGKFGLAITGGGSSAISQLLAVAGASNTLINAVVPYSTIALTRYLGGNLGQACSELTARQMAMQAFLDAKSEKTQPVFGIGATAALQTNRQRKGNDRIFIALQAADKTFTYHQQFDKQLDRPSQETLCANAIIRTMAYALGIINSMTDASIESECREQIAPLNWQNLLNGKSSNSRLEKIEPGQVIFPGAFNPPHPGHFAMAELAEKKLNRPVIFELSTFNVDKPPLDYFDMAARQESLEGKQLIFTRAPTFIEKARIFPGCTFVVGVDTITRIANKKYYHESTKERDEAIEFLCKNDHQFLVFGRLIDKSTITGQVERVFHSLSDVDIPEALSEICLQIDEQEFRLDASSTELRGEA